jgi:predicted DNA-binding transcriptional regulator AlpA
LDATPNEAVKAFPHRKVMDESLAGLMTSEKIDPYLRKPAVLAATGLSDRTLHRMVKAGTFPSPKRLGPNSVGWRASTIKSWNDSRPDARQQAAA